MKQLVRASCKTLKKTRKWLITKHSMASLGSYNVNDGAFVLSTNAYLAGAKETFPYVNGQNEPQPPKFEGSVEDFLAKYKENEALKKRMLNKVKKCTACNKPNAFTLATCNQCGADLTKLAISYTNNVFTGFVYGIQKGPFPLTISMRSQTEGVLVFDDLLSLTACHLNVIPSTHYIPDWRYLLQRPKQGLDLLNSMYDACWNVVKTQFLANAEWKAKILKGNLSDDEIKSCIVAGFNYPPSQYQLHLQFMLPPFLPFHYHLYLNGVHFTTGRFFPIEYARAVLEYLIKNEKTFPVNEDTSVQEIFDYFAKNANISYETIHTAQYARYGENHRKLSNWKPEDFNQVVVLDKLFALESGTPVKIGKPVDGDAKAQDVTNKDKAMLQNYGRPLVAGKNSGTYYKFARTPGEPNDMQDW